MTVTLDFIATRLQRVLEELQQLGREVADVKQELSGVHTDRIQLGDEMTVLTGMVLRYSSEHIARGGVQSPLERLEERIGRLERSRPGAP